MFDDGGDRDDALRSFTCILVNFKFFDVRLLFVWFFYGKQKLFHTKESNSFLDALFTGFIKPDWLHFLLTFNRILHFINMLTLYSFFLFFSFV